MLRWSQLTGHRFIAERRANNHMQSKFTRKVEWEKGREGAAKPVRGRRGLQFGSKVAPSYYAVIAAPIRMSKTPSAITGVDCCCSGDVMAPPSVSAGSHLLNFPLALILRLQRDTVYTRIQQGNISTITMGNFQEHKQGGTEAAQGQSIWVDGAVKACWVWSGVWRQSVGTHAQTHTYAHCWWATLQQTQRPHLIEPNSRWLYSIPDNRLNNVQPGSGPQSSCHARSFTHNSYTLYSRFSYKCGASTIVNIVVPYQPPIMLDAWATQVWSWMSSTPLRRLGFSKCNMLFVFWLNTSRQLSSGTKGQILNYPPSSLMIA